MTSSTVLSSSTSSDSLLKVESNGYVRNNWYQSGHPTRSHSVQSMIGVLEDLIVSKTDEWHFTKQRADEVYAGHNELIQNLQKLEDDLRYQQKGAKKRRRIRILIDTMKVTRARVGLIGLKLQNREKNDMGFNILESELQRLIEVIHEEELAAEIVKKEPDEELDETDSMLTDVYQLFLEGPDCKPHVAARSGSDSETFDVLVCDIHALFDEMLDDRNEYIGLNEKENVSSETDKLFDERVESNKEYLDSGEIEESGLNDIYKLFHEPFKDEIESLANHLISLEVHTVLVENFESFAKRCCSSICYVFDKGKDKSKIVWILSIVLKLMKCNGRCVVEKQSKQTCDESIHSVFDRGKILGALGIRKPFISKEQINKNKASMKENTEDQDFLPEIENESALDGELGRRLNQMVPLPHVPKINGNISSVDKATSDQQRLWNRSHLHELEELKIFGDCNCQFCSLSDQIYRIPEHHKIVREEVVNQLNSRPDLYEKYVSMTYTDYLKKMSINGERGDHVTLQVAANRYSIKMFVITSFKDTCYKVMAPFLSLQAQECHMDAIFPGKRASVSYPILGKHGGEPCISSESDGVIGDIDVSDFGWTSDEEESNDKLPVNSFGAGLQSSTSYYRCNITTAVKELENVHLSREHYELLESTPFCCFI